MGLQFTFPSSFWQKILLDFGWNLRGTFLIRLTVLNKLLFTLRRLILIWHTVVFPCQHCLLQALVKLWLNWSSEFEISNTQNYRDNVSHSIYNRISSSPWTFPWYFFQISYVPHKRVCSELWWPLLGQPQVNIQACPVTAVRLDVFPVCYENVSTTPHGCKI